MVNGTPAYQQTTADGSFPPKAFTQTAVPYPVTLTKHDCEQKLKEAYEEIERLRAEVARLQAENAFLLSPENHTADGLVRTFHLGGPSPPFRGDGP